MEQMHTEKGNTIFIGDQMFTDVFGANRTGIPSIMVKKIHWKEEIQIVLKRRLEAIVLTMKLVIGNDHAAVELKNEIKAYLEEKGHEVINIGTDTHDSCNYPEYGEKAGRMVAAGEADGGVLICGTGVGISIAANKVKGVRAAVCSEPVTARLVKEHNNANIIAFGARIVGSETAKAIVDAWLDAKFQGGRHQTRIDMIHKIEE